MKKLILFIFLWLFLIPSVSLAYTSPGSPDGFVNDYANVLTNESGLETNLLNFELETGHEIAVVTINSLEGDYIENYAVKLFEEWGIGKKKADNGVLFLVAVEDREMRIEVGYGLEGALTDLQSRQILDQIAKPYFQNEEYNDGIFASVEAIKKITQGEVVEFAEEEAASWWEFFGTIIVFGFWIGFTVLFQRLGKSKAIWPGGLIGAVVGTIFFWVAGTGLGSMIGGAVVMGLIGLFFDWGASRHGWFKKRPGGKGGRSGGIFGGGGGFGSGGGFGGFGGGSSGGGGSSSSW